MDVYERGAVHMGHDDMYLEIAKARKGPYFYIVDGQLRVLFSRLHAVDAASERRLPVDVERAATQLLRDESPALGDSFVALVRPGVVLRLVPLQTSEDCRYALFLEFYEQRDLLRAAVQRYALTARESDVLELLLLGESTASIAAKLYIAETTVQHHVKNLGAKIGVTTRKEIVGAVLRVS